MKRFLIPSFTVALTLISSCNTREEMVVEKQSPRFRGGIETVVFDAETRAFVDENNKVYWNEGDHITIFSEKTYNREFEYQGRTGTTSADFERYGSDGTYITEVPIESGFQYAIFPYQRHNACDYDGTLTVPFPANRTYEQNTRGIGIYPYMVARDKSGDFMFMHIAGYLGLQLYGEGTIKSISIKSTNNEPISGYPVVVFTDDSDEAEPVLTFVDDPDDSPRVTITYPEPIALPATSAEAKTFWLTLPPTVMTKGFTLTFTGVNGEVVTKSRSSSYVVERKKIKTLGPLEIVMGSTATVTGVELNKNEIELNVNETEALTATVLPASAPDKTVSWSSSDNNVATVSSSGVVTAVSAGTAVITVTTNSGGKTATCNVTVKEAAPVITYSLAIDPQSAEIKSGEKQAFTLALTTTTDGVAETQTVTGATWTTSDESVATVANGTATGIGAGTATITAKFTPEGSDEELTASATLTVTVDAITYSLAIDPESAEIKIGETKEFILTLTTTTNGEAVTQTVTGATWASSDATVATVANGTATGVAEGTVSITAKYTPEGSAEELTVTAQLKVNKKPNQAGDEKPVEGEEEL